MSADGGEPQALTTLDQEMDASRHYWPSFLPGRKTLLTTLLHQGYSGERIAALSLESARWQVIADGSRAQYVPPGYLIYYDNNRSGLLAVKFDAESLQVEGSPVSVVDSVYRAPGGGAAYFAVSRTGSLVYLSDSLERSLMWMDREGRGSLVTEERRGFRFPRLSPDGSRIALIVDPRPSQLWIYDLQRSTFSLLHGGTLFHVMPAWSPEGTRVVFSGADENAIDLYLVPADGSGTAEPLLIREHVQSAPSWSPDGRVLAFQESNPTSDFDIWVMPLEGDRVPERFVATAAAERYPAFSPNGRWMAYQSDASGEFQIYVRPEGSRIRAAGFEHGDAEVGSSAGRQHHTVAPMHREHRRYGTSGRSAQ